MHSTVIDPFKAISETVKEVILPVDEYQRGDTKDAELSRNLLQSDLSIEPRRKTNLQFLDSIIIVKL